MWSKISDVHFSFFKKNNKRIRKKTVLLFSLALMIKLNKLIFFLTTIEKAYLEISLRNTEAKVTNKISKTRNQWFIKNRTTKA